MNVWQSSCRCVSVKLSHYQCKLDRSLAIRFPLSDRTSQKKAWQVERLHFTEVAMQISEPAPWSDQFLLKIAKKFWNNGRHDTFLKNAKRNSWICASERTPCGGLILLLCLQSLLDVHLFLLPSSFYNGKDTFPVDWKGFCLWTCRRRKYCWH